MATSPRNIRRWPKTRVFTLKGVRYLASKEGWSARAYKPVKEEPYWTIGYGHYGSDVKQGQVISRARGIWLLRRDARTAARAVRKYVKTKLNQDEFNALVSLVFNIGVANFRNSTLLRTLNAGDRKGAADEFLRWNKGEGGRVLEGLSIRRREERAMFLGKR